MIVKEPASLPQEGKIHPRNAPNARRAICPQDSLPILRLILALKHTLPLNANEFFLLITSSGFLALPHLRVVPPTVAPTARLYASLGQRSRYPTANTIRAENPAQRAILARDIVISVEIHPPDVLPPPMQLA